MGDRLDALALDEARTEADRVLTLCNACRYCEGFCPVFKQMTDHRTFTPANLEHMANLCHHCTACFHACQYKPPHAFEVNVPRALAALRDASYEAYAWPPFMARALARNGLFVALLAGCGLAATLIGVSALAGAQMHEAHAGPGAFYRVIGHGVIVLLAGTTSLLALIAFWRSWRAFAAANRPTDVRMSARALKATLLDLLTLRHLGGGHGDGCNTADDRFSNARRILHQCTAFGFVGCFAATCVATVYELGLGRLSPFPLLSLPVVLGSAGGASLLLGTTGQFLLKLATDAAVQSPRHLGMDYAFIAMLWLVSATGFALLIYRGTDAMGVLLAVHLGFVLAFFLMLPYSKAVHGLYRVGALYWYHASRG